MLGSPDDLIDSNALQIAKHCAARGRYELAEGFHRRGTKWYEVNVVGKIHPDDTKEDRAHYREVLRSYYGSLPEFPLLAKTRDALIEYLRQHPGGVDRDEARKRVQHNGATNFGVICNQLDRGGWIRQEKNGKRSILRPSLKPPINDQEFLEAEVQVSGHDAGSTKRWWQFWKR